MSWKKFFSEVPVAGASDGTYSAMGGGITGKPGPARSNYSSFSRCVQWCTKQNRKIWTIQCDGYGQ